MANVPETSTWETGVYQFETTDPIQGGPGGVDNTPHQQLGNRTKWLYDNKVGTTGSHTMAGAYAITGQFTYANNVSLKWLDSGSVERKVITVSTTNVLTFGDVDNGIAGGEVQFRANSFFTWYVNAAMKMVVTSAGRLGLGGVTAPSAVLHTLGAQEGLRIQSDNGFLSGWNLANNARSGFLQFNAASGGVILSAEAASYIKLNTNGSTRIYVDQNGGVGIGTIAPGEVLDVAGYAAADTPPANDSSRRLATTEFVSDLVGQVFDMVFPVGTITHRYDTQNPGSLYPGTTWTSLGSGRVLVGISSDSDFDTIGETGGEKTHTLTTAEMPAHKHVTYYADTEDVMGAYPNGVAATNKIGPSAATNTDNVWPYTSTEGGGGPHNNLQPYVVVAIWRRTS